jgi:signal transduction histidine kinase
MSAEEPVNILLVDDQPGKLLGYEVILSELGENLIKAGSANEALEQLLKSDVAVVLVDVCMPDLDGFELAAMIREHPRFQKTAIIFVSAIQVTDLDLLRGYAAGAVDYVPVPVVPDLLRAKVRVFAERYRTTRKLETLNAELERRVAERTAELAQTNADLEHRVEERTREREAALAQVHEMQKVESLGQLTGGVAHDFNNLLMAVLGNLEILSKCIPDDPKLRGLIDGAIRGAERGATLTKRMLAFARRQELRPETVDVPKLVDSMVDMLSRSLGPSIEITTEFEDGLPATRVDPNQLELALLNLALNARDAMPSGGNLTISARRDQVGQGDIPGLSAGEYVCIAEGDTGIGPRAPGAGLGWACRWSMALSRNRAGRCGSAARSAQAPRSSCGYRSRKPKACQRRVPPARLASPTSAPAGYSLSMTIRSSCRARQQCSKTLAIA